MNAQREELKQLSSKDLHDKIAAMRHELLGAKLALASGQLKDISQVRKIRKNIAYALTKLNEQKEQ